MVPCTLQLRNGSENASDAPRLSWSASGSASETSDAPRLSWSASGSTLCCLICWGRRTWRTGNKQEQLPCTLNLNILSTCSMMNTQVLRGPLLRDLCATVSSSFQKFAMDLQWGNEQHSAFQHWQLKEALTSAPVLTLFRDLHAKHTVVVTDTSKFALGAVQMQGEELVSLLPVAYYSHQFNKTGKHNYMTREQELLAISEALQVWHHYTLAVPVTVKTDHDSLLYINLQPNLTGQLARWFKFLAEYNITEISHWHIPGKDNVVADALSRRPDYAKVAALFAMTQLHLMIMGTPPQALNCSKLSWKVSRRTRYASSLSCSEIWQILKTSQTVSFKFKRVTALPTMEPWSLLSEAHETRIAGHLGVDMTYGALAEGYYWPCMWEDVHRFVTTCFSCQTNKPDNTLPAGQARSNEVPEIPFLEV
eukprot:3635189-Rhodomonas_salina.2